MTKSDTLQLRLTAADMEALRRASKRACMKLSEFVRHQMEPVIVASMIAEIAADFDYITSVRLFGSVARGDHGPTSDIDVAIETDGAYRWMGERGMGRFVSRLEDATGRSVDVVKAKYCSPELSAEIDRSGRIVYER